MVREMTGSFGQLTPIGTLVWVTFGFVRVKALLLEDVFHLASTLLCTGFLCMSLDCKDYLNRYIDFACRTRTRCKRQLTIAQLTAGSLL